jgi:hypothetical protein
MTTPTPRKIAHHFRRVPLCRQEAVLSNSGRRCVSRVVLAGIRLTNGTVTERSVGTGLLAVGAVALIS